VRAVIAGRASQGLAVAERARPEPPPDRPSHGRALTAIGLGALVAASFVLSLVLARSLFPLYSLNHDDAMYVYEAHLLGDGHLTLPAAQYDAFRPWASGVRDGRVVMKYAPPWPAVLTAAEGTTGSMRVGAAVIAAAAVGLVYLLAREVLRDEDRAERGSRDEGRGRRVALLAAGLFALSPVTLIQSGTFLPYLFQLVTGLAFAVGLLVGVRRGTRWPVVAGGAALGVGLFARPFDALLFALPFVAVLAYRLRDRRRELWRALGLVAAGAAPLVALDLLYNAHTMGGPLTLPFTVTGPHDTVGFGQRGIFASTVFHFGPRDGLRGLVGNMRWLPTFTFGGVVTVGLAVVALVAAWRAGWRRATWLWALAGLAVSVCVGYVFFWSPFSMSARWPGAKTLGPFYHLPVLVPVVILGARGLDLLWRSHGRARRVGLAAVAAGVALTALALPPKIDANADVRDDYRSVRDTVDALGLTNAVLVVPGRGKDGFQSPAPFLENRPDLDEPILYAEDRGKAELAVFDRFPERAVYQLVQQQEPGDDLLEPSLVPVRLRLADGPRTLAVTVTNPTRGTHVVATITDGRRRREVELDTGSQFGERYTVSWRLADGHGSQDFLPDPTDAGTLTVGLVVSDGTPQGTHHWARRFPYRTAGGRVQLVEPGRGYELFAYRHDRSWLAKDIDDILTVVPG
jgi:hypothetical protein